MYVRQLAGRQSGMIVEMDAVTARAAKEQGTVEFPTDDEIHEAGFHAVNRDLEVPPREVVIGYRVEPNPEGFGWDLLNAGGVRLNKDQPFHNRQEAMDAAESFGRRARGLPEKAEVWSNGGKAGDVPAGQVPYEKMTVEDLRAEADRRKLDTSKANKKADWIALLQRDDEVKAAVAAGNFDVLTVPELMKFAADHQIDVSGKTAKQDLIDAIKAGYKPAPAADEKPAATAS